MGKREKLVIELNVIARTNISDIEKKRRMNDVLERYEKDLRMDVILGIVSNLQGGVQK